jgi:hypothetical protein
MALKASLRFLSRKIAEAVAAAAKNQGLDRGDYFLFGSYSEESDHVYLLLKVVKPVDELRLYKETFDEIRRLFPDDSWITMQIAMVIRQVPSAIDIDRDSGGADEDLDITYLLERASA